MNELERARQALDLLAISLRLRGKHDTAQALLNFEKNIRAEIQEQQPKRRAKRVK